MISCSTHGDKSTHWWRVRSTSCAWCKSLNLHPCSTEEVLIKDQKFRLFKLYENGLLYSDSHFDFIQRTQLSNSFQFDVQFNRFLHYTFWLLRRGDKSFRWKKLKERLETDIETVCPGHYMRYSDKNLWQNEFLDIDCCSYIVRSIFVCVFVFAVTWGSREKISIILVHNW